MIVGIAVNYAAAKMRETRERFGFEESKKLSGESATLGIVDVGKIVTRPERAGNVPFQVAGCGGMRKIQKCGVDFRQ